MARRSVPFFVVDACRVCPRQRRRLPLVRLRGNSAGDDGSDAQAEGGMPFQADPATVYVAKVKNILVGLPPTDAEIQAVAGRPDAARPAHRPAGCSCPSTRRRCCASSSSRSSRRRSPTPTSPTRRTRKQIDINSTTIPLLMQNAQESFARTMLQLIANGQPLTQATTTTQLMMTTAMKELYAFLDVWRGRRRRQRHRRTSRTPTRSSRSRSRRRRGPSRSPRRSTRRAPTTCTGTTRTSPTADSTRRGLPGRSRSSIRPSAATLHYLLYGSLDGRKNPTRRHQLPARRRQRDGAAAPDERLLRLDDGHDPPARRRARPTTTFYDLPTLRHGERARAQHPARRLLQHAGVLRQLADEHEQHDARHDEPGAHRRARLDGRRHRHDDAARHAGPRHGARRPGRLLRAATRSSTPRGRSSRRRGRGTTTARSTRRGPRSPASSPSAGVITAGEDASATSATRSRRTRYFAPGLGAEALLLRELVGLRRDRPGVPADRQRLHELELLVERARQGAALVAHRRRTRSQTATATQNGEVVAVSRRDHLCAALNARLGFTDVCGLDSLYAKGTPRRRRSPRSSPGCPSDGYGRGAVAPVLPNQPTLFFRAGDREHLRGGRGAGHRRADRRSRRPGVKQWSSAQPTPAIADFVSLIMGLTTSDPRAAPAQPLLHAALPVGARSSRAPRRPQALQSTFVAACLAPSAVSIGM